MKVVSKGLALVLVLAMVFSLAACGAGGGEGGDTPPMPGSTAAESTAAPDAPDGEAELEKILIACSMPLTGSMAESGVGAMEGIIHAVDEWNENGGVQLEDGMHQIELLIEDDAGQPETAVANFEKFINSDNAKILYGIVLSGSALAAMELVKKYPDVMMSTVRAVSAEIPAKVAADPEGYKNFFKPEYNSTDQGENIAAAIESMGSSGDFKWEDKTVAFLTEDNDYGRSTMEGTAAALEAMGATTVAYEVVPEGTVDFYTQLNKIKQANPEVVVANMLPVSAGVAYCKQYKEIGLEGVNLSIGYPEEAGFYEQVGEAGEGLLWTIMRSDFANNPKHIAYAEKFEARYGHTPNYDHLHTYDTTNMLLEAIQRAGVLDANKISEEYLQSDYQGNIGRIVFDKENHSMISGEEYYPHSVAQIQNGASVVVWPGTMATADYIPQT